MEKEKERERIKKTAKDVGSLKAAAMLATLERS